MGHLYDPFWTIKIRLGWQGGVREGKNLPEKWPQFGFGAPQRPPNVPRTPEMDPKWPPQLTLIDLSKFPVSLTHLGAPGVLQS